MSSRRGSDPPPRVLVIARQAGSAAALAPVVSALRVREWPVEVLAFPQAHTVFAKRGIACTLLHETSEVLGRIRAPTIDAVVTGTSLCVEEDGAIWARAREHGIPSVGLLDHWSNYWERFTSHRRGTRFDVVPDRIAVMDEYAAAVMTGSGCPPELVVVTGQPALAELATQDWPVDVELRSRLGVGPGDRLLLFVSEPVSADYGRDPDGTPYLGYSEADALQLTLEAVATVSRGQPIHVLVKPHPTEGDRLLREVLAQRTSPPIRTLVSRVDGRCLAAGANAVVGMTSILLVEAALMGRPVASVRPNARAPFDVVRFYPSLIADLPTAAALVGWLQEVLAGPVARPRPHPFAGNATTRVVNVLEEALAPLRTHLSTTYRPSGS